MDRASRLLLLLDIVEAGSFTKAADRRNVNRSVISRQIGHLEEDLQVRLFNRSTRSLSLTDVGREIYQRSLLLRATLEETEEVASAYHGTPKGTLKVSCPTHFGRLYVDKAVRIFLERYPETHVELQLEERTVDIIGGGYDLAIRLLPLEDSNLIARPLARNRPIMCASPAFIERFGMPKTIEELAQLPAAIYSRDGLVLDSVRYTNPQGGTERIPLYTRLRSNDPLAVYSTMRHGLCFGVLSSFVFNEEITKGDLLPLLPQLPLMDYPDIHIVYPHREYLPLKTARFVDCLKEVVGDPPVWERSIPGFASMYGHGG
ncbi:LysR family transcriptional regulator [Halomonas sp. WWR20]